MPLLTRIALAVWPYVLGLLVAGGVVLYLEHRGAEKERQRQLEAQIVELNNKLAKKDKISAETERELTEALELERKRNERLNDETRQNPVYRSCVLPDNGLRLYNEARIGKPSR